MRRVACSARRICRYATQRRTPKRSALSFRHYIARARNGYAVDQRTGSASSP